MIIMMMMLNIINHQLPWVVEEGFAMSESTTTSDLVTKSASIKAKKIAVQFSEAHIAKPLLVSWYVYWTIFPF